jgi:hypothetical protein
MEKAKFHTFLVGIKFPMLNFSPQDAQRLQSECTTRKSPTDPKVDWVAAKVYITSLNPHFPSKSSTQDLEKKKAEPRTPHFLTSNQDIVV